MLGTLSQTISKLVEAIVEMVRFHLTDLHRLRWLMFVEGFLSKKKRIGILSCELCHSSFIERSGLVEYLENGLP